MNILIVLLIQADYLLNMENYADFSILNIVLKVLVNGMMI